MPNKETKKLRNTLSLHLNELKKEHTDQSLYKEGRNKEQSRKNEIETKKTIEKISELGAGLGNEYL